MKKNVCSTIGADSEMRGLNCCLMVARAELVLTESNCEPPVGMYSTSGRVAVGSRKSHRMPKLRFDPSSLC